jgi:cobalt-zinc-cadmium resistance protein CzcA
MSIPFVGIVVLLLITPNWIQAQQTVTLDEVITMAIANNPRLKSAAISIDRSRAAKGESWDLGATAIDYSWGQLNGPNRNDRLFGVTQSLGSIITPFYKNALVKQQINTNTFYRDMVEKEIIAEAKHAWAYYQYAYHKKQMLSEQNHLAELLSRTGDLRFQQGEITLLEKNMTSTQAASMKNKVFQAEEEFKVAAARLQWVCYSDNLLIPSDTQLGKFSVNTTGNQLSTVHVSYFNSKVSESEAQLKVERSLFFPEFSAGFVRQHILPDKGLDSWMVGVSVPLLFNGQRSRVRQAQYELEISRYETQDNIRLLNNKIYELYAELRKQDESIRFFETSALSEANAMVQAAQLQLQHSDISIIEFIQSMNSALEIKQSYIEMVYQYNVAALEYELYRGN